MNSPLLTPSVAGQNLSSLTDSCPHLTKIEKMKRNIRKQEIEIFSQSLQNSFRHYCAQHRLREDLENFTTYIIDRELISPGVIRQYAILAAFAEVYPANGRSKTETVERLADRFNLTTRSIWNVLRKSGQ